MISRAQFPQKSYGLRLLMGLTIVVGMAVSFLVYADIGSDRRTYSIADTAKASPRGSEFSAIAEDRRVDVPPVPDMNSPGVKFANLDVPGETQVSLNALEPAKNRIKPTVKREKKKSVGIVTRQRIIKPRRAAKPRVLSAASARHAGM